jgi:hypothetical protein
MIETSTVVFDRLSPAGVELDLDFIKTIPLFEFQPLAETMSVATM